MTSLVANEGAFLWFESGRVAVLGRATLARPLRLARQPVATSHRRAALAAAGRAPRAPWRRHFGFKKERVGKSARHRPAIRRSTDGGTGRCLRPIRVPWCACVETSECVDRPHRRRPIRVRRAIRLFTKRVSFGAPSSAEVAPLPIDSASDDHSAIDSLCCACYRVSDRSQVSNQCATPSEKVAAIGWPSWYRLDNRFST